MLRSALIWLSKARWAQQMITHWNIAWRVASRFMAGETLGAPTAGEDGRFPPLAAIASHDEKWIRYAIAVAERFGLSKLALEFQMLYGIRRDLQDELVRLGYPVRIYVPYGTHWYPYLMRRLVERPANAWFFISNFLQK